MLVALGSASREDTGCLWCSREYRVAERSRARSRSKTEFLPAAMFPVKVSRHQTLSESLSDTTEPKAWNLKCAMTWFRSTPRMISPCHLCCRSTPSRTGTEHQHLNISIPYNHLAAPPRSKTIDFDLIWSSWGTQCVLFPINFASAWFTSTTTTQLLNRGSLDV